MHVKKLSKFNCPNSHNQYVEKQPFKLGLCDSGKFARNNYIPALSLFLCKACLFGTHLFHFSIHGLIIIGITLGFRHAQIQRRK